MNYGGFWIRFLAYVVDSLIVTIGFIGIVMVLTVMGLELFSPSIVYFVLCILYWALMQSSARQATIGKALVGLKVTDLSGARLTVPRALAREAAKIISSLTLLIGYIIAAFTSKKQALHDFVASTVVVRVAPGHVLVAAVVALLVFLAPVVVGMLFGVAMLTAVIGPMAAGMMGGPEIVVQAPKPAAPAPTAPTPTASTPPAPAPAPAAPATPKPQPQVAQAPAPEAPKPAPVKEPAKPAPSVKEPAKPVAKEPAKPAAKEPAKPVAKEPAKPVAKEPEPAMATAPAEQDAPKAAPAPRKTPAAAPMQVVMGPTVPGPRFNDLITAVLYRDAKAVNELLSLGKWPDKPDSSGMTPLMIAASQGDAPIAEALLKAGAKPNLTGPGGATALSLARERRDAALVGLLQNHGAR